jgi:hypothetical protein
MARIAATGVVLAIVVLEIQLALGFRLADTPLFRYPWHTVGLIARAPGRASASPPLSSP